MIKKIFILVIIFSSISLSEECEIKGAKVFVNNNQTTFPVIVVEKNHNNFINIQFDVKSEKQPELSIYFEFCDKNWEKMESVFFYNEGKNIENILEYKSAHYTNKDFDYYYQGRFPNRNVTFPFSGKWRFLIVDTFNKSKIYYIGYFYVVYNKLKLKTKTTLDNPDNLEKAINLNNNQVVRLEVEGKYPEDSFPHYLQEVEMIEDQKIDFPIVITTNTNTTQKYFETDGHDYFKFVVRDIFKGNEYRILDLTNHTKYPGEDAIYRKEGLDIIRRSKSAHSSLNGGSQLINSSSQYANYLNVTFCFNPYSEYSKDDIYVVGSFNDWQPVKMKNREGNFEATINMKRGKYDYQYIRGIAEEKSEYNWVIFEGNFLKTRRTYHIFIYSYCSKLGGYDQIIGYIKKVI